MADGLQRRPLEGLLDAGRAGLRIARQLRADLQHLVAEAVTRAQQQHRLVLQLGRIHRRTRRPRMLGGHHHHEGLVIDRPRHHARHRHRLGHHGHVDLAQLQRLQQLGRQPFLQQQRHAGHGLQHGRYQTGQQVGTDGVDDTQAQRPMTRVLAFLGNLADGGGLFQHALGLLDDALAHGGDAHLHIPALEELHFQLVFQLLDGHRQGGLAHEAGLGRPAEVSLAGHGHDVFQFSQSHRRILSQTGHRTLHIPSASGQPHDGNPTHGNGSQYRATRRSGIQESLAPPQPAVQMCLHHVRTFLQQPLRQGVGNVHQRRVPPQVGKAQQHRP